MNISHDCNMLLVMVFRYWLNDLYTFKWTIC